MVYIETEIEASGRRINSRGGLDLNFDHLSGLLNKLRASPNYGWLVNLLEHFSLSPEKLYQLIDILDIGTKLKTAADILERHGIEKRTDADGWTVLEEEFNFSLPGLPAGLNKWHFSFRRDIRAFRLTTSLEREGRQPLEFKIECCLGKKSIDKDGLLVLTREGKGRFRPVFPAIADNDVYNRRDHRLALTAAKEVAHTTDLKYGPDGLLFKNKSLGDSET